MALGFWLWVSRGGEGCCSLSGTKRLCSALGGECRGRWSDIVDGSGVPFCAAGRTGGGSGFCGVFVCVRASMASTGRAFNLSGQPDGEQRPAVSYSGARAEQVGSSSRRTAFKGRLGVILRCVETRTLACQLGHAAQITIDNQLAALRVCLAVILVVRHELQPKFCSKSIAKHSITSGPLPAQQSNRRERIE